MCNIMTTAHQIKDFIENYNIENELKKLFDIICTNSEFKDKNYNIKADNIEYHKSSIGFHRFKTPIFRNTKEIGYFALEYDLDFNLVDDFFVIYDEIGILINKIAQNKIDFEVGKELILKNEEYNFHDFFEIMKNYIFNSIPNKLDYNSESYQEAIKTIPLKRTYIPVVILTKFPTKIAFNKLRELLESEHSKIITSLLWIYKITVTKRRETECKNGCGHSWHNLD